MLSNDDAAAADPWRFTALAVSFEIALGVLAVLLGYVTGPRPWSTLTELSRLDVIDSVQWGTATALVLLFAIVLVDRRPVWIFRDLQRRVRQTIIPLFRGTRTWQLLVISLAAGVGEEFLFRGYCQAALAERISLAGGNWWALLAASILFGACHWLSSAYAFVATVMGLVLGWLMMSTGSLLAPIMAHALYDFLALVYLLRKT